LAIAEKDIPYHGEYSAVRHSFNFYLAITTAAIAITPTAIRTTTKHPPGLGNPFRINPPPADFRPTRRWAFVQNRNGFIAAVMPNSFFTRFLAFVMPRRVLREGRRPDIA
jgi:hypothetical protein